VKTVHPHPPSKPTVNRQSYLARFAATRQVNLPRKASVRRRLWRLLAALTSFTKSNDGQMVKTTSRSFSEAGDIFALQPMQSIFLLQVLKGLPDGIDRWTLTSILI
jgi:hypothetical protein